MIPTAAVIPTRYEPARLASLLEVIVSECDELIVLDNGHEEPLVDEPTMLVPGMGLYAMWNLGWRTALEGANWQAGHASRAPVNVAILNDDIRILPGTLSILAEALRAQPRLGAVYPDVTAKLRDGLPSSIEYVTDWDPAGPRHLTGFAFMFKGELDLPPFDEGYEWWYGDTQFDESVRLAGYGVARVVGLPIEHKSDMEMTGWRRRPELRAAVERDGSRWARLHDRIENGRWVPR